MSELKSYPETSRVLGESRPEFLRDELLHEFVERTAERLPAHPALKCGAERLTYGQLLARARDFAEKLRARGLARGDRVAIWMPRGLDMYVVVVAILEAGGVFVPLDPDSPVDRVNFVVGDCGARFLVTAGTLIARASALSCSVVNYDEGSDASVDVAGGRHADFPRADPDDCAYIIYTSGSTGRPKGVMISHRAICHFVRSEGAVLDLKKEDLVFQGASLSFDMSLEEIWPAWAVGATLLVGTAERLRSGADLAPWLEQEGLTVWTCVPTMLSLQEQTISTLRLLNLGGEACPPELVRRWWRPGLRILNTYGPTEATITATYTEVTPDRPITIGRPLPNYTAIIVDENLKSVAPGTTGELLIGGPGLALGYVGRADLTSQRFILNPFSDRAGADPLLYRTGDLARLTPAHEIEFLGRIDTQVKIRGFRVELSEIEAVLLEDDSLKQAVVDLQRSESGEENLVAYVVLRESGVLDEKKLRAHAKSRLPSYMVPAAIEPLASLPTQPSGKVDRKQLPRPSRAKPGLRKGPGPQTTMEKAIHAGMSALFPDATISIDDDFFLDLGGHSLLAAALVSALRKKPETRHVSMIDVYNYPTARALAARLESTQSPESAPTKETHLEAPSWKYFLCGGAQALGLILVYGLFSLQWMIPYFAYAWLYNQEEFGRSASIAISLGLFVLAIPVMLAIGIAAKWLILGRLRPGEYPLWGWTYYRWWLSQRLLDTVPIQYLGGTPLLAIYLRLLGARIGRGVHLDNGDFDAPDCVEIGDDTSFTPGATISCCKVEYGRLKVGRVKIGKRCHLGTSSVLGMNTTMEDEAELENLSMLAPAQTIPAGERWGGSPARFRRKVTAVMSTRASDRRRRSFGAVCAGLLFVFPLFAVLPIFPGMILMTELDQNTDAYSFILLSPLLAIGFVGSMCLQIAALKWLLVGRVQPAKIPLFSLRYLKHWLVGQLMHLSLDVVNPLYATLYLNPWYRMLGVKLGARAEVSTASSIGLDLLEVGEESFIADAVSLGAPRVYRGELSLEKTVIGRRAFVGNCAVIPTGTKLGDGVLVGVLSKPPEAPEDALKKDSSWFGTPAVFLPRRQISAQFDEGCTFRPKRRLLVQRLAIEFVRVILPLTIVIALTSLMMSVVVDMDDAEWGLGKIALSFPVLYLGFALSVGAIVLGLKWLLIGRYRPVEKPLWSRFVWRSELVTSVYENLAVPFFAEMLRGTPFLAMYLRLLGCRIGRRVYMDTTDITEFDLVRIGDEASLNNDCGPQTHLFEDRVMKISTVEIGARCTIGGGSVVLYDAKMEPGSTLGELSMLMKGETLPANTHWEGSPARPSAA